MKRPLDCYMNILLTLDHLLRYVITFLDFEPLHSDHLEINVTGPSKKRL